MSILWVCTCAYIRIGNDRENEKECFLNLEERKLLGEKMQPFNRIFHTQQRSRTGRGGKLSVIGENSSGFRLASLMNSSISVPLALKSVTYY